MTRTQTKLTIDPRWLIALALLLLPLLPLWGGRAAAQDDGQFSSVVSTPKTLQGQGRQFTWSAPGTLIGYTWTNGQPEQSWALAYPGANDAGAPSITGTITGTVVFYPQPWLNNLGVQYPRAIPDVSATTQQCQNRTWVDAFNPANGGLNGLTGEEEGWLNDVRGEYNDGSINKCSAPSTPVPATPTPVDGLGCSSYTTRTVDGPLGEPETITGECVRLLAQQGSQTWIVATTTYVKGDESGTQYTSVFRLNAGEPGVEIKFNGSLSIWPSDWLQNNRGQAMPQRSEIGSGEIRHLTQNPGLLAPAKDLSWYYQTVPVTCTSNFTKQDGAYKVTAGTKQCTLVVYSYQQGNPAETTTVIRLAPGQAVSINITGTLLAYALNGLPSCNDVRGNISRNWQALPPLGSPAGLVAISDTELEDLTSMYAGQCLSSAGTPSFGLKLPLLAR